MFNICSDPAPVRAILIEMDLTREKNIKHPVELPEEMLRIKIKKEDALMHSPYTTN